MGTLEERNRKLVRRTELQEVILATVATVGVIGIGLLAPNVVGALSKLGVIPHSRENEVIKSTASRLRKKGLLVFENGHYSLTETGEKILRRWQASDYKVKQQKKRERSALRFGEFLLKQDSDDCKTASGYTLMTARM